MFNKNIVIPRETGNGNIRVTLACMALIAITMAFFA